MKLLDIAGDVGGISRATGTGSAAGMHDADDGINALWAERSPKLLLADFF